METTISPPTNEVLDFLRFKAMSRAETGGYPFTQEYQDRLEMELQVINDCGFNTYFLIIGDLCDFMRRKGIRYVVRGSGCGSLVIWYLGISHRWLDPLKYHLPFERFLNKQRISPPDVDMDIDDSRRHEVVVYTQEKYGKDRVARIVTFGTLGAKQAINDVGRALEIPNYQEVCSRISECIPAGKIKLADAIEGNELLREYSQSYKQLFDMAKQVEGKTRHASVHAAGVVIAPEPMTKYLPLYFAKNPDAREPADWDPATQWDMYDCENRGLLKMDYLGLKTLRVINRTVAWINADRYQRGETPFDIDTVPQDDQKTWELLNAGKLSGIFQVERQFVRNFAKRMNLLTKKDPWSLAVLVAIIRPGMMDAGTTEMYLRRASGQEQPTPPHPLLAQTFKDTYGIMCFQEDVMWCARDFAGFTLAEADVLRKGVGKKKKEFIDKMKPKFVAGAAKKGATKDEAEQVWGLIEAHARYSFNNAHAAAYGMVISYQTAYLKANYPLLYMACLINSESGVGDKEKGYNAKVAEYVEEARSLGIKVNSPCITTSGRFCTVNVAKNEINFGLEMIKRVSHGAADWIITHRNNVNSLREFVLICHEALEVPVTKDGKETGEKEWKAYSRVGKTDLEMLIQAGAFDVFDQDRAKLLTMLPALMELADKYWKQECKVRSGKGKRLRDKPEDILRAIHDYQIDESTVKHIGLEATLEQERAITGCFLSESPFTPYRATIKEYETCTSDDVANRDYEDVGLFAAILRDFRTHTIKSGKNKGAEMAFLTFTGYSTDVEVVAFAQVWNEVNHSETQDQTPIPPPERGKVYLVGVRHDRDGKSSVLDRMVRLSNTSYAK